MLVFSPIIKEGEVLLEQIPFPYSLFLIPYLLFKSSTPTVKTVGYKKYRKNGEVKMLERTASPLGESRGQ